MEKVENKAGADCSSPHSFRRSARRSARRSFRLSFRLWGFSPEGATVDPMNTVLPILIFAALGAVVVVLILGLFSLAKSGPDRSRSNRLMQWRVALQGVALLIILIAVLISRHQ
jgi:Hypoxia induced protein conserved region